MGLAPLHDFAQFLPVVHVLKRHLLHRRTGDDHAVKFPVFQLLKALVKGQKMLLGHILGLVGRGMHQLQIYLKGSIAQKTAQLSLGDDLGGHQIQQNDLQGTDILGRSPAGFHDKYIFLGQRFRGRQVIGDLNGHYGSPLILFVTILSHGSVFVKTFVSVPRRCNNGSVFPRMYCLQGPWHRPRTGSCPPDDRSPGW